MRMGRRLQKVAMSNLVMTIRPTLRSTRILMTCGQDEVLKAILPSSSGAHRTAAPALLDGVSLWYGQKISVVLAVDSGESHSALSLCNGLGFGSSTLHYDVVMVEAGRHPTGRKIHGVGGGFAELKQLCLRGGR